MLVTDIREEMSINYSHFGPRHHTCYHTALEHTFEALSRGRPIHPLFHANSPPPMVAKTADIALPRPVRGSLGNWFLPE